MCFFYSLLILELDVEVMSWRCGIDPGRWAGKVLHRCETSASDEEEYGNRNHELVVIGNGF